MTSYTPRPWNDDERDIHDYISYHNGNNEKYIPVYQIMKEYYDEEKERIYNIDLSKEYTNAFECIWEEYWESTRYFNGYYSDYSNDNLSDYSDDVLTTPVISDTEKDEVREDKKDESQEETISTQSKFYYI
jgi:hypothetical protein